MFSVRSYSSLGRSLLSRNGSLGVFRATPYKASHRSSLLLGFSRGLSLSKYSNNSNPGDFKKEQKDNLGSQSQERKPPGSPGLLTTTVGAFVVSGITAYVLYYCTTGNTDDEHIKVEEKLKARHEKKSSVAKEVTPISPDQVEQILSKNQKSFILKYNDGTTDKKVKVHCNQVASNDPIEDRMHVETQIIDGQLVLGVFDGHSGYQCSDFVSKKLPGLVRDALKPLYERLKEGTEPVATTIDKIKSQIQQVFCSLDDQIVHSALKLDRKNFRETLAPAVAGSCALLASVDFVNNNLFVACTGDSRAVLGRVDNRGNWVSSPLTEDQTARNSKELMRVLSEHPGEEKTAVRRNRILGSLEPFRAFGDARYKWDFSTQTDILPNFFPDRKGAKGVLTPPYVTAKPEVTYHKLNPRYDEFLILATDGLYDELSNDQIVSLVGESLASPQDNASSEKPVFRRKKKSDLTYVFQDSNAATHLMRNAFGGGVVENNEGKLSAPLLVKLLSIPAPHSRRYRDDISIIVLQFGNVCPITEESS